MLKLAYKFLLLFLIVISTAIFLNSMLRLPYYWGNPQLAAKEAYLKEQAIPPKAYFIGSSITYHAVNPTTFCEVTNQSKHYAFNLGVDGAQPPQTFYLVEALLKKETPIDYIFLELNSFDQMAPHLFQTTRNKYYYRLDHFWASLKYFIYADYLKNAGLRITHKLGLMAKHGVTFLESTFKIGMRKEMIKMQMTPLAKMKNTRDSYGYYALLANKEKEKIAIDNLRKQLATTKQKFTAAYSKEVKAQAYNPVLQEMLMDLIHQAKAKNIEMVYLLTPFNCAFDSVSEMRSLFESLPPANRIDLANPNKYPTFYEVANRWDIGHFNDAGATLYTQKLGEFTKQLLQ